MRLLFISGQGNSYQTSAALATAFYAARTGLRVLIASTGPTHMLGAMVGQTLGSRPVELEPKLSAIEVSARDEIGERWDDARQAFRSGIVARLRDVTSEELPSFPGIDLVGSLMIIDRAIRSQRFDLLVFDGPSMDTLLRGVALADTLRWFVRLVVGIDRGPGRSRSSQDTAIIPGALIPPSTTAPLQDLRMELERQRAWLDPANGARIRLVVPAEELGLPPIRQALGGLGLYGVAVDTLIAHGDPDAVDETVHREFESGTGRPRLLVDPLSQLPVGKEGWAQRGEHLYDLHHAGLDLPPDLPDDPLGQPEPREVRLTIPFLDGKALDITVASEEVVLRMGAFRRHLLLPGIVNGGRLRARVENETLRLWVE